MEEKENTNRDVVDANKPPAKRYIQLKPFSFVMLVFGLILVTAVITFFILTTGEDKVVEVVKPQQQVPARQEFQKFFEAYDEMKDNYFEDIDKQLVIDGAINGMIDALGDPYSDYLNEDEARQLNESISSSFEGIGAEIQEQDGYIAVVSPIKNSPAEKAGLLPRDKITAVDGESIQGMSSSEAVLLIRGQKGTPVTLTIIRNGLDDPMEIEIIRDVIPIETVYWDLDEDGIGHVHITSFSMGTYDELLTALDEMEEAGLKGLVVDVRQNPGGTLDGAIDISNLFVEKGKNILQYQGKKGKAQVFSASSGRKVDVPVSVIIDDGSASASEILAGALSESSDIPLVGITTFGKGTVQSPKDLPDGSNLKLTTAKWLTPDGNWIHQKGIKPDFEVPYPDYAMLPFLNPSIEMEEGMVSTTIESAEKMLEATGYNPGVVDGLYDAETTKAVKALQADLDIEITGVLTGDTTFGLMNKLREKIENDDPQLMKAKEILLEKIKK
ncbi:S41 family peptidase [Sporosarcina pasteurii]|uniref:Carboxy-terminal processing protease CtpB n=1 Tax=Sporosarcina pasteurii TaxID=1474 RepID=A0A380BTK1_SPOPA|nr:S41 family peptidase [Sporosarcina pasteurii]MDS9471231.1 S41 family peptidase [Sporosarcina pasteurii]QBQ05134.1 PDZ domain-containing protein [Sporosarcina pasteurii]SUJ05891.1 Carboxy-terminal processing protease CtpB precursor [Sporosarcina pasteurii]